MTKPREIATKEEIERLYNVGVCPNPEAVLMLAKKPDDAARALCDEELVKRCDYYFYALKGESYDKTQQWTARRLANWEWLRKHWLCMLREYFDRFDTYHEKTARISEVSPPAMFTTRPRMATANFTYPGQRVNRGRSDMTWNLWDHSNDSGEGLRNCNRIMGTCHVDIKLMRRVFVQNPQRVWTNRDMPKWYKDSLPAVERMYKSARPEAI